MLCVRGLGSREDGRVRCAVPDFCAINGMASATTGMRSNNFLGVIDYTPNLPPMRPKTLRRNSMEIRHGVFRTIVSGFSSCDNLESFDVSASPGTAIRCKIQHRAAGAAQPFALLSSSAAILFE